MCIELVFFACNIFGLLYLSMMTNSISCLLLFYGIYFITIKSSIPAKSGPFTSTLVRAENCKNPTQPYQTSLSVVVAVELYNVSKKTMLRGNYTSRAADPSLKLTVQDYFLVNKEWQLTFRINEMSCRGRIVSMMGTIFGIKFNKKTCAVPKGVYVFNNIDYDFVDHVFLINREYGKVLRKVEVVSKHGTAVCLEFESVVTPKN